MLAPPSSSLAARWLVTRDREPVGAGEVDRDRGLEPGRIRFVEPAREDLARVVHEDVEADRALAATRFDLARLGQPALVVAERGRGRVSYSPARRAGTGDGDGRARCREHVRDRVSDPGRAAGDEHARTREVERRGAHSCRVLPDGLPPIGLGRAVHGQRGAQLTERLLRPGGRGHAVEDNRGEVRELTLVGLEVVAVCRRRCHAARCRRRASPGRCPRSSAHPSCR